MTIDGRTQPKTLQRVVECVVGSRVELREDRELGIDQKVISFEVET